MTTGSYPIGVVCSSGGGSVDAGYRVLRASGLEPVVHLVTDRPCPAESLAKKYGWNHLRIPFVSRQQFSAEVAAYFRSVVETEHVNLFYTRLIDPGEFSPLNVVNFHPTLLPKFPGLRGWRDFLESNEDRLGTTAHIIDEGIDTGPVLVRISSQRPDSIVYTELLSHLQKVVLFVLLNHSGRATLGLTDSEGRIGLAGMEVTGMARLLPSGVQEKLEEYVEQRQIAVEKTLGG